MLRDLMPIWEMYPPVSRICATGEEQCRSNGCNSLTLVNADLASVPDWIGNFTGFGSGPTSPVNILITDPRGQHQSAVTGDFPLGFVSL